MSLSVEVTLIASTAYASGVAPVADGSPVNLCFVGVEFSHVDVVGKDGIGRKVAPVHLLLEP